MASAALFLAAMAAVGGQDKPSVGAPSPAAPPVLRAPPVWDPAILKVPRPQMPTPRAINPSTWISQDDYPAAAKQAGVEGTVGYRLRVDASGRATDCQVVASSGNADLDAASCSLVTRRGRFEPARDAKGQPMAGTYTSRVRWALRGDWRPVPKEGEQVITLTVAPDGTIADCTFAAKGEPASRTVDPCRVIRFAPREGPDAKSRRLRLTTRVEYLDPQ